MSDAAAGKGLRGGEGSRAGDRPARSRRGSGPAGCPRRGRGSPRLPRGRAGRGICAGGWPRGRVTASGRAGGAGKALTWTARRTKAAASRASAAAAAMSAGPRRRRRQTFPSNAPARRAAPRRRLTCVAHACGSGSKGAAAAPAQRGAARQDGGERATTPAARAARGPAALPASRALFLPQDKEKKKKESILDLSKYIDKTIRVKFQGGREGETPRSRTLPAIYEKQRAAVETAAARAPRRHFAGKTLASLLASI